MNYPEFEKYSFYKPGNVTVSNHTVKLMTDLQQAAEIVAKQQGWKVIGFDNMLGLSIYENTSKTNGHLFHNQLVEYYTNPAELIRVRNEVATKSSFPYYVYDVGESILKADYPAALINLAELITLIEKK